MKNFTNLRHSLLFCVVSVSVFATRLLPAQEAASEPKGKYTPGRTQSRTYFFKAADKKMPFSIYVPKGYDKKKSYPLMVALHGLGSSHWQIIRYPGLTRLAQKHGYIVVAPMGYNSSGWYGADGRFTRFTSKKILRWSEQDVMNVLAITRKELSIDDQRIFLMGHSMGGGGTWHLGMKFPKKWAALAPLAPAAPRNIGDLHKIKDIPVVMVMGSKDFLWRSGLKWVAAMKKLDMDYEYIEVKNGGHVLPVIAKLPTVFAFFEKHRRKPLTKP